MSENTKIEWATHTFNPWEGCQRVGPGCDNCYAEARNARFAHGVAVNWGPEAPRRRTSEANWRKPLQWNANHEAFFAEHGHRQRVFCASLADVFDNTVDREWRDDLATLILSTPNLDWLLLTKRIGNAGAKLGEMFLDGPPDNVWLGATIVNQKEADRDIPKLLAVLVAKRFLSMEPLLGPVNLTDVPMPESGHGHHEFSPIITGNALKRANPSKPKIDWVIVGGESGPKARPMHPKWARSLRDQCQAAGVPFLFKQWGELSPESHVHNGMCVVMTDGEVLYPPNCLSRSGEDGEIMFKVGKKVAGRLLDGRTWDELPI
jgi:protein gp37